MLVSAAPFLSFLLQCACSTGCRRVAPAPVGASGSGKPVFPRRFSLIYLALPVAASADFLVGLGLGRAQKTAARRLLLGFLWS